MASARHPGSPREALAAIRPPLDLPEILTPETAAAAFARFRDVFRPNEESFLALCAQAKRDGIRAADLPMFRLGADSEPPRRPLSLYASPDLGASRRLAVPLVLRPLHWIASAGFSALAVRECAALGFDPCEPDRMGLGGTALHMAVRSSRGPQEIGAAFIEIGVSAGSCTHPSRRTPMHLAAEPGEPGSPHAGDWIRFLSASGASVEAVDNQGERPLHAAARCRSDDAALALLDLGADPNAIDGDGRSPLHFAALSGGVSVFSALIERGARWAARDAFGRTPLHYVGDRGEEAFADAAFRRALAVAQADSSDERALGCSSLLGLSHLRDGAGWLPSDTLELHFSEALASARALEEWVALREDLALGASAPPDGEEASREGPTRLAPLRL
jgi:hypothetical protein